MRTTTLLACIATFAAAHATTGLAQDPTPPSVELPETVPLSTLVSIVADNSDTRFLLDPRARAEVLLIGQEPDEIDYDDLLDILAVHGFVAVRSGDYVRIVPDANARQAPSPVATEDNGYADAEIVTRVLTLRSVPAATLVPMLRPLLPQFAHMAATSCGNKLVIVDTAANVARIARIIEQLDTGRPVEPPSCEYMLQEPGGPPRPDPGPAAPGAAAPFGQRP